MTFFNESVTAVVIKYFIYLFSSALNEIWGGGTGLRGGRGVRKTLVLDRMAKNVRCLKSDRTKTRFLNVFPRH